MKSLNEERAEVEVVFERDERLKVSELSNYLYNLKVVYTYLLENPEIWERYSDLSYSEMEGREEEIREELIESLEPLRGRARKYNLFRKDLGEDDLEIIDISRENPWSILTGGVVIVIVASLVLSGGKLKLRFQDLVSELG